MAGRRNTKAYIDAQRRAELDKLVDAVTNRTDRGPALPAWHKTDRTVLWGECYDCGKLPTVATDTDINERFCANCAEYTKSIGNSIKYDGEVREG